MNLNNMCMFEGTLYKDPEFKGSGDSLKVTLHIRIDRGYNKDAREKAKAENKPTSDFVTCYGSNGNAKIAQFFKKDNVIKVLCTYSTWVVEENGQKDYRDGFRIENITWPAKEFNPNNTNNSNNNNNNTNKNKPTNKPNKNDFYPAPEDDYTPF